MKNYEKEFPLKGTKVKGITKKFDFSDPIDRREYFNKKADKEIKLLKKYFDDGNTFIAYFLGKKGSGKGTYAKMMIEIFGEERIGHISVGDIVRAAHKGLEDEDKKKEIIDYLSKNYRGYISVEQAMEALLSRDTKTLLPTEFILTLVKKEIDRLERKILFIDGFPRDLDQVSYSLYFRDLINYREDPDVFVAIDIPEIVIDERMKNRVVCPKCQTPRNLKLLATKQAGYDEKKKKFYLMCDNPACDKARMGAKEGDSLGIEAVRDRLELDDSLIDKIFTLHGIPKVLLRNAVPVDFAKDNFDDYEITPEYVYECDESNKRVKISEKPWILKDDQGNDAYSLMPPAVVLSLIKQLVKVLEIS
ncbi:nucleoside monophosphate kinase [Patescibacteria group bacterium]|nr:nucleoside monophosphate kinase [Patescibacteria group bacterium]MBU4512698.1 nucleoside monophosphate kinase [Patescibacteria group bacterium]MCG2693600.1 nucleoside monophosphate kinase [Candidatus Parcubacteria bacterium]